MLRIHCPYCGERDHEEFSYFGDATKVYPPLGFEHHDAWIDAVYLRDNPKGEHLEFWHHTLACRRWLVVRRNTVSHDIVAVMPARERPAPPVATLSAATQAPG